MRFHEILLIPSAGHTDDDGKYCRGHDVGAFAEVDLVDRYVSHIADVLENDGVRYRVLETRKAPGIPVNERHQHIDSTSLAIHCAIGYLPPIRQIKRLHNISQVFYGHKGEYNFAKLMMELCKHWGELFVFGHQAAAPKMEHPDPVLKVPCAGAIRLEPFIMNGPHAAEYALHLPRLGQDIGRTLSHMCQDTNKAGMRVRWPEPELSMAQTILSKS